MIRYIFYSVLFIVPCLNAMKEETPARAESGEATRGLLTAGAAQLIDVVKFFSQKGYVSADIAGVLDTYKAKYGKTIQDILKIFEDETPDTKEERMQTLANILDLIVDNAEVKQAQATATADLANGTAKKSKICTYVVGGLGALATIAAGLMSGYLPTVTGDHGCEPVGGANSTRIS